MLKVTGALPVTLDLDLADLDWFNQDNTAGCPNSTCGNRKRPTVHLRDPNLIAGPSGLRVPFLGFLPA